MKKHLLHLLLFVCVVTGRVSSADLKESLLNYGFERVRLTNACKSRIIDFVKAGQFDSVDVIVNFADSINAPNREWLSEQERFFLEVIRENIAHLSREATYVEYFGLADTVPGYNFHRPPLGKFQSLSSARTRYLESFSPNPAPVPDNENLYHFLMLSYREKLKELREKEPGYNYIWDFFDLLFHENYELYLYNPKRAKAYLRNYGDSPLSKLVIYNFGASDIFMGTHNI